MKRIVCILILLAPCCFAGVPSEINYQGRLTDSGGNAVTGDVSMAVRIYDSAENGNELYSEDIGTVTLDVNGIYSFQFGSTGQSVANENEPALTGALQDASSHWLELSLNGIAQSPREKILTVPFSLHAGYADEAGTATGDLREEIDALTGPTPSGNIILSATYPNSELEAQGYSILELIPGQRWIFTGITPRSGNYGSSYLNFSGKMWCIGYSSIYSSSDGAAWSYSGNSPNMGLYNRSVATFDGKMWVMGGKDASYYYNQVWCSGNGTQWTQATANADWAGRHNAAAVEFQNKLWLMGGEKGSSKFKDVWWTTNGTNWTQATASANWLAGSVVAFEFQDKLWVIDTYSTVWWSTNGITWNSAGRIPFYHYLFGNDNSACVVDDQIYFINGDTDLICTSSNGSDWEIAGVSYWSKDKSLLLSFENLLWVLSDAEYSTIARSDTIKQDNGLYYYRKD
ncbi:Kelch repeat-containing protein [Tichowtungia aerotolerans]|uniref:Uncharacterized protein n=1 Tax=Tichowtungia aerotolerans TaxID=2697043 RepID=A0A6P1M5Y6_9BACT|nr:hypothetical protein [Tichowtungia aerotolerans]QHI69277.1 hypothetical protein GT409_07380 [Tichowtungia aerotolerans]